MSPRFKPSGGLRHLRNLSLLLATLAVFWAGSSQAAFDTNTPPVAYHTGFPYSAAYFANALSADNQGWKFISGGTGVYPTNQLNKFGYPTVLIATATQVVQVLQNSVTPVNKPDSWPDGSGLYAGQIVITWKGGADVRSANGTYVAAKSTVAATGVATNGTRVYTLAPGLRPSVNIYALGATPLTDVKCWLPDPTDPNNKSLENQLFHPAFLKHLQERRWSWIRFMNLGSVNQNPQKNWSDRRIPAYAFQDGALNPRDPTEGGVKPYGDGIYAGNRDTGVSFEYMVALCNQTTNDMWLNIPHLANDTFVTNLANLIKFGSDGTNAYTSVQANPVWKPLNSALKVYLEYSNEIWAGNDEFAQGVWAANQAAAAGITKAQFIARRGSRLWEIFESKLTAARVVRVAGAWTARSDYTTPYVAEFYNNASLLKPEVLAVTTYFGNGIQYWAKDQNFVPTNATPWTDSYWASARLETDLQATLTKWMEYVLSGTQNSGDTGPDELGVRGGITDYMLPLALSNNLPLVAYEGGPSVYTSSFDGPPTTDDGVTLLMEAMNRHPGFADIYYAHVNMSFEKGLRVDCMFTDAGQWGKNGQWGHLEYIDQPTSNAPKYQLILDVIDEFKTIRSIHTPKGLVPQFTTAAALPRVEVGTPYNQTIAVSGGNGTLTVECIASLLPAGLTYNASTKKITGTPTAKGDGYVYLRVLDADKDPAWRTFTVQVFQRSTPAATINFETQPLSIGTASAPQPMVIGAYTVNGSSTNGLKIFNATNGWPLGWPSKVLHAKSAGWLLSVQRTDGQPFDLYSVDVGEGNNLADQCTITLAYPNGTIATTNIAIPLQTAAILVPATLDAVGITKADFRFYKAGANAFGAIDNLKINQVVTPPGGAEVILDNNAAGVTASGAWYGVVAGTGYQGTNFMTIASSTTAWRRYTPTLPTTGSYEVFAKYASGWATAGTNCPYTVVHQNGSQTTRVNQTINGGTWVSLGTFNFTSGNYVEIGADVAGGKRPCADAIKWVQQ
ncbi:MAG: hypothetical protein HOO88_03135 [Kiritimatiellaceae bacterium]|nr:hypothetical protein [Kiritimatiellaceae bacterium]